MQAIFIRLSNRAELNDINILAENGENAEKYNTNSAFSVYSAREK